MSEVQVLKPQKTWSHLAARRRKPSEYDIVSTNLHYNDRDPDSPYELAPEMFMNQWYKKHTFGTALKHADWNAFRDPDEVVYRTYNLMQDGQETYVFGLFDQFNQREHDKSLDARWAGTLARLYSPARYLFHTLQMASAYVGQVSPASTITNCHYFQMADSLRWLSHTAYRTKELSLTFADKGFGQDERQYWEQDTAWQGFRELMEKTLTTWDWGEAIIALNLIAKPAIEEAVLRRLGEAARHNGDVLLGLITDAQLIDVARHRRWLSAFSKMALETEGNRELIQTWVAKWEPLADSAIEAYCAALPDVPNAAETAIAATHDLRRSLGF
ncbi:aromatic/alkene monooxygenase hydroxylase subunit beta [uncultured Thiothrix sp.]|uniref:aromatic/alkene monooxygenase hydroxylase subunit beta n=1 Tax=uncultured Thiothrix sp. TaxID=223185 RepID=UPI002606434A|nr:aromatic/alkene monooxygenase hydroxylase subunit beta [uncultured Thiothrix sp.]HMT93086.1 aromatic/alkene monooxygenase hydroxylase subunit beta [Thiolinea sp.]